jgi:NADPH2:quinone reductase
MLYNSTRLNLDVAVVINNPHLLSTTTTQHTVSIYSQYSISQYMHMQRMMRAIQVTTPGPSSALELVTKAIPVIGASDLLVKNAFAGVNYIDTYHRSGVYPLRSNVIGMEGAGEVVSVGESVTSVKVGDLVAWPSTTQSYAEYVAVPHDRAVLVPSGVGMQTACAAMLQGLTAHYLVAGSYNIKAGDWALVHAASGGVGLILTQMIKARGGNVIGTCSTEAKAQLAREAGADHVIVGYDSFPVKTKELTGGKGVDVVYDGVGKDTFIGSLDSLKMRGMMVLFGGASGQVPPFDLQGLSSRGSLTITRPTLFHFISTAEELQWRAKEVFDDIVAGKLKLTIGAVYPIENVKDAHDDLEGRKTIGKLLLQF